MKRGSLLFAALMVAVGLGYVVMALKMPRGTFAYPGPGLFPVLVGVFLTGSAVWCLVQELRARSVTAGEKAEAPTDGDGRMTVQTWKLTGLTAAFILALKPIGYPIAICAFLVVAIRIFGYRKWLPAVAMAGVITAVSYVSFVVWLKVPLPMGLLDALLG